MTTRFRRALTAAVAFGALPLLMSAGTAVALKGCLAAATICYEAGEGQGSHVYVDVRKKTADVWGDYSSMKLTGVGAHTGPKDAEAFAYCNSHTHTYQVRLYSGGPGEVVLESRRRC
jgi:hypothetical protein